MTIRPFDPDRDYPAVVACFNANFPDFRETEAEFRYHDDYREADKPFARFVAEEDGALRGYSQYSQGVHAYHPEKFDVDIQVLPQAQGRGVGRALYEHLLATLAPHTPSALRAWTQTSLPRPMRFLADRGHVEDMRIQESWLDVAAFDPTPFDGAVARVEAQGIVLTDFVAVEARWSDARRRLYDLAMAVSADIPSTEPFTPVPYDVWTKRFDGPNYAPDTHFLALDQDRLVGISSLWLRQADTDLQTGVTGILPDYRRRGIALALKLQAIAYAQRRGAPTIRTDNAAQNVGMLSINRALGFVPQPAWVHLTRALR